MIEDRALPTGSPAGLDNRRYRILRVLGKGGFGTVYHARLEGADGFVKEVAIKILKDRDPDPDALGRFRDEARILGRLRDRALVSVDPPTRLGGRWAVIMEYVDGSDCNRLLRKHSRLPQRVAVEIIEEVARALDHLWNHPGDDGMPLHLLHRDLKPSNLQVTPGGGVKILDFGVARADFDDREALSEVSIGGTPGYVAPERYKGLDGTPADIFSLGRVLGDLVTGRRRADRSGDPAPGTFEHVEPGVIALIEEMTSEEERNRPTAAQVERRCAALANEIGGPSLSDWAREYVPREQQSPEPDDDLVGQTLSEAISITARAGRSRPPGSTRSDDADGVPDWPSGRSRSAPSLEDADVDDGPRRPLIAVSVVVAVAVAVVLLGGVGLVGVAVYAWPDEFTFRPQVVVAEPAAPAAPADGEGAVPVADPEPADADPDAATPAPQPRSTSRRTHPRKPPGPSSAPKPAPKAPSGPVGTVTYEGADAIELTGTPGRFTGGTIPAGSYSVRASFDGAAPVAAGTIDVAAGARVKLRCDARFKRCLPQ